MHTTEVRPGPDGKLGTGDDQLYVNGVCVGTGLDPTDAITMSGVANTDEIREQTEVDDKKKQNIS